MEAICNRCSVQAYTDQPVDKTTVEALIKALTHAPSSMNEQPWTRDICCDSESNAARSIVRPYQGLCAGVPRRRGLSERGDAAGSTAGAGDFCLAVGSGRHP